MTGSPIGAPVVLKLVPAKTLTAQERVELGTEIMLTVMREYRLEMLDPDGDEERAICFVPVEDLEPLAVH